MFFTLILDCVRLVWWYEVLIYNNKIYAVANYRCADMRIKFGGVSVYDKYTYIVHITELNIDCFIFVCTGTTTDEI